MGAQPDNYLFQGLKLELREGDTWCFTILQCDRQYLLSFATLNSELMQFQLEIQQIERTYLFKPTWGKGQLEEAKK